MWSSSSSDWHMGWGPPCHEGVRHTIYAMLYVCRRRGLRLYLSSVLMGIFQTVLFVFRIAFGCGWLRFIDALGPGCLLLPRTLALCSPPVGLAKRHIMPICSSGRREGASFDVRTQVSAQALDRIRQKLFFIPWYCFFDWILAVFMASQHPNSLRKWTRLSFPALT